jgi:2-aminoethylphosphonate-pyruvate transaminase
MGSRDYEMKMNTFHGPDGQEDMPYLLTAGPVTTSRSVKIAMLADFGARDTEFISLLDRIRRELLRIGQATISHDCVLQAGSGTFAIEAALGSFCPARRKKTLVISNGASGERAAQILEKLGRPFLRLSYRETSPIKAADVAKSLDEDRNISHVWFAHCETSTGMLNPLSDIAQVVKERDRFLLVDAISSFGGVAINIAEENIDVLVGSAHTCLEGVPGVAFTIARRSLFEEAAGVSHSLALDLHVQWKFLIEHGQFRFAPPTHVISALAEALQGLEAEGGVVARVKRYQRNADTLRERLRALGFTLLLSDIDASPIVQTILSPKAVTFEYRRFYAALRERGFAIQSGQLAQRASFRVGCIGQIDEKIIQQFVVDVESVMKQMQVNSFTPADV